MSKDTATRMDDVRLEDSGLTLKQEAVATALAIGRTVKDISEQYGVSSTRIYEWRQMPVFCTYLKRLQREMSREIRGQLSTMKDDAVDTIAHLMKEGKEEVQLKAACYVLDSMIGEARDAKKLKAQLKKLNVAKK